MRRYLTAILILFLCAVPVTAQRQSDQIRSLAQQLATQRIRFSYSINPEGKPSETTSGKAIVQKGSFSITMNGMKLLCDGKATYTINPSTKEIYIEPAAKIPPYLTNPENLAKALSGMNSNATSISGKFTNPDNKKQVFDFTISSLTITDPEASPNEFSVDASAYGNDWVITDLR